MLDSFDINIRANSIIVRGRVVPKPGQPLSAVVFSMARHVCQKSFRRLTDVDSSARCCRRRLVDVESSAR